MKNKKFYAILLSMTIALSNVGIVSSAKETQPVYDITDEYIVIDSVPYEIVDNTIQYNGMIFELQGYTLVSYDDDGSAILLILPIEQNKVTDPTEIARLNSEVIRNDLQNRSIPSNPKSLPYSADVAKGKASITTPYVEINPSGFNYYTVLDIYDISTIDRVFSVYFSSGDVLGNWYSTKDYVDYNFSKKLKIINLSVTRYGIFDIDSPSSKPSYTYEISLSNKHI